jgi:hypothetical protein
MEVNPVFRGRDFKLKEDLCFVIMPLRSPFPSIFENHIKPIAKKCGLTAVKADDINSNKPVMEDVWAHLNRARIVVADLTGSNPNVFYELGIAHTLGKEVIMISQRRRKPPFDVGHVRFIPYTYPSKITLFEKKLRDTITQVLRDSKSEVIEGQPPETKQLDLFAEISSFRRSHRSPNVNLSQYEKKNIILIFKQIENLFPKRKKLARAARMKIEPLAAPVYHLIQNDIIRLEQDLMKDTMGP